MVCPISLPGWSYVSIFGRPINGGPTHFLRCGRSRPWARYLPGIGSPGLRWLDTDGNPQQGFAKLRGSALLSETGTKKLFALSGHDVEALFEKHANGRTGSFELGVSASLARTSTQRQVSSANVVAVLEGQDPELKTSTWSTPDTLIILVCVPAMTATRFITALMTMHQVLAQFCRLLGRCRQCQQDPGVPLYLPWSQPKKRVYAVLTISPTIYQYQLTN
jgi:hypothetical protein